MNQTEVYLLSLSPISFTHMDWDVANKKLFLLRNWSFFCLRSKKRTGHCRYVVTWKYPFTWKPHFVCKNYNPKLNVLKRRKWFSVSGNFLETEIWLWRLKGHQRFERSGLESLTLLSCLRKMIICRCCFSPVGPIYTVSCFPEIIKTTLI